MQPKPKRCIGPPPQYVHQPNYQQYKNGPRNREVWLLKNNPSSLQPPRTPIMNACMSLGSHKTMLSPIGLRHATTFTKCSCILIYSKYTFLKYKNRLPISTPTPTVENTSGIQLNKFTFCHDCNPRRCYLSPTNRLPNIGWYFERQRLVCQPYHQHNMSLRWHYTQTPSTPSITNKESP